MFRTLVSGLNVRRPDLFTTLAVTFGFLVAGAFSGLIIAYGKPVMIALAIGAILSLVLFNVPAIAMWMVLVGSLIVTGPLLFHVPSVDKINWLFAMLGLFLLVAAVLYGGLARERRAGPVPPFLLMAGAFIVLGIASLAWVEGDANVALTGMKRYYQFFGLTFALGLIAFPKRTVGRWVLFFLILALIQLPYVFYQRLWLVMRLGYDMDSVVGLFEASREGHGSSGSLGFLQIIVFAGLLSACREKLISVPMTAVLTLVVVAPLFLADLNVVFVLLPTVAIIVFADLIRKRPLFFLTTASATLVVVAVVGAGAFMWQQSTVDASQALTVEQKLNDLIEYNFGSHGYAQRSDVNRTTVYSYWWRRHGLQDPIHLALGHGIGSTFFGENIRSPLSNQHNGISINLTAAAQLLWELGVVGLVLYLAMLASAWKTTRQVTAAAPSGFPKAFARTLQAGMACVVVFTFYTNTTLGIPSQEVLIAMVLGFVAWTAREYLGRPVAAAAKAAKEEPARAEPLRPAPRFGNSMARQSKTELDETVRKLQQSARPGHDSQRSYS